MHRKTWLALALVAAGTMAATGDAWAADVSGTSDAHAIAFAEDVGWAIYRHDRAAEIATDEARKHREFRRDKRVKGWITEGSGKEIVVTFVDDTPAALYRITVPDGPERTAEFEKLDVPAALSLFEAGAAAARTVALSAQVQPCSRTYNIVVLPMDGQMGQWQVYLLPGTTRHDVVPLGGTHRIETDGTKVLSQRAFTRSCIALPRGGSSGALMITHLLDPTPTEAHVHWSLWAGVPMFVATQDALWKIEGGAISALEDEEEEIEEDENAEGDGADDGIGQPGPSEAG